MLASNAFLLSTGPLLLKHLLKVQVGSHRFQAGVAPTSLPVTPVGIKTHAGDCAALLKPHLSATHEKLGDGS